MSVIKDIKKVGVAPLSPFFRTLLARKLVTEISLHWSRTLSTLPPQAFFVPAYASKIIAAKLRELSSVFQFPDMSVLNRAVLC